MQLKDKASAAKVGSRSTLLPRRLEPDAHPGKPRRSWCWHSVSVSDLVLVIALAREVIEEK